MSRRPLDKYPTEEPLTQALLGFVDIRGNVLEACAGAGQMARVLDMTNDMRLHERIVWTNDIDPQYKTDFVGDAGDPLSPCWADPTWHWVVTNPPFLDAPNILPLAWEHCKVGIAFLLRLTYQEPAGNRADWLNEHKRFMSHFIIFGQPRPSFTGNGKTDSVTTAWMVWRKDHHQMGTQMEYVTKWKR